MPPTLQTPEELLGRSDSRNPATTCKGLTSSGRPCRRALAAKTKRPSGVLALVDVGEGQEAAAFFCWQHQGQARLLADKQGLERVEEETRVVELRERSRIDTLVQRLGVLDFEETGREEMGRDKRRASRQQRPQEQDVPAQGIARPKTWESISGPVMLTRKDDSRFRKPAYQPRPAPKPRKQGFWSLLCCGAADADGEGYQQVRRRENRQKMQQAAVPVQDAEPARPSMSMSDRRDYAPRPVSGTPQHQRPPNQNSPASRTPVRKPVGERPQRPNSMQVTPSKSPRRESNNPVPSNLPPQIRIPLLRYLSSPISVDDKPGYIYMFWLTPASHAPPQRTASTLLSAHPDLPRGRRASDVLSEYSSTSRSTAHAASPSAPMKILLKIGRTDNVWRRMREWGQQCGTVPNLLRYYPYVSSSPSPSPHASPSPSPARSSLQPSSSPTSRPQARRASSSANNVRQVPHATRVERLIHLELAGSRVDVECVCGTVHREWFEIEASMQGVRGVDEVCRRWVAWDESGGGGDKGRAEGYY